MISDWKVGHVQMKPFSVIEEWPRVRKAILF